MIPKESELPKTKPGPPEKAMKVRKLFFEWQTLTSNNWILDTIKWVYKEEFDEIPVQTFVPNEILVSFTGDKANLIDLEIEKLLNKGVIKKCELDQFISNIFVVPKKDGSLRPVLNFPS